MHVLITGGAGFLGKALAARLLHRGHLAGAGGRDERIDQITLTDVVQAEGFDDPRIAQATGDIADPALLEQVITGATTAIFHLAAVVSGQAEADFDLGMRVNLDGTRALLEGCRSRGHRPCVVFASSVAVYGGALPEVVLESTPLTPQTSVRHAESDRRAAGGRLHAKRIRRWALAATADGHGPSRETQCRRIVVRERHHQGTGERRGVHLPGRSIDEDVGDLAGERRRRPHPRARSAGG